MKHTTILLLLLITALSIKATAETNILSTDHLTTKLNVTTTIEMKQTTTPSTLKYVQAEILFIPLQTENQKLLSFESDGSLLKDRAMFVWTNPKIQDLKIGYSAIVDVYNKAPRIKTKIPYPLSIRNQEKYLQQTKNIDYTNPKIQELANKLAKQENDLFLLVSKVGNWVKNNIKYDLNTLTASASKPASWVLQNKIGVCDEITSLFIAILRAQGIPAKFISGISYTNNPKFSNKWGPHGWAEVYFPGTGWVPFDVTFGEFGWTDPGHIKLKESTDPQEPTTQLEWKGLGVQANIHDLDIKAKAVKTGKKKPSNIKWTLKPAYPTIGFGSYNVLIAEVENTADYYIGTELTLAKVKELETEEQRKQIILKPKEKKRIFWKIKIKKDLSEEYQYDIPLKVYDFRNISETTKIKATAYDIIFNEKDADNIIESQKTKETKKIELECKPEKDIKQTKEKTKINCIIENHLPTEKKIKICLNENCKEQIIPKENSKKVTFTYTPEKTGANEVKITAKSTDYETKTTMTIIQLDEPKIDITNIKIPQNIKYGDKFNIKFTVKKTSIANPKNVIIEVTGNGAKTKIPIGELTASQNIIVDVNTKQLYSKKPKFKIKAKYEGLNNKKKKTEKETTTTITGIPFWKNIIGWLMNLF